MGERPSRYGAMWHRVVPFVGVVCLAGSWGRDLPDPVLAVILVLVGAAVVAGVHHAEVVATRVGEPFGSLVLAVAVTVIEVGLIVALMASDGSGAASSLARDTVFAALMITCNGILGAALVVDTFRGGEATFNPAGASSGLSAIAVLATLSLVLPRFTTSTGGPTFTAPQLAYAAVSALVVYVVFVVVQAVRHREHFLPLEPGEAPNPEGSGAEEEHGERPTRRTAATSLVFLVLALVSVVGLAKVATPLIESGVASAGLPSGAVPVSIALLVLLPESIAAVRAARRGRFQTSVNLAFGSAMASIGLTIPAIALLSGLFGYRLILGLDATEIVLLAITVVVAILTVAGGRATLLQGALHLAIFAGFLILVASP